MKIVYVVCENKEEARKIGRSLLNKKLVACVNIFPIESLYWWEGIVKEQNISSDFCSFP